MLLIYFVPGGCRCLAPRSRWAALHAACERHSRAGTHTQGGTEVPGYFGTGCHMHPAKTPHRAVLWPIQRRCCSLRSPLVPFWIVRERRRGDAVEPHSGLAPLLLSRHSANAASVSSTSFFAVLLLNGRLAGCGWHGWMGDQTGHFGLPQQQSYKMRATQRRGAAGCSIHAPRAGCRLMVESDLSEVRRFFSLGPRPQGSGSTRTVQRTVCGFQIASLGSATASHQAVCIPIPAERGTRPLVTDYARVWSRGPPSLNSLCRSLAIMRSAHTAQHTPEAMEHGHWLCAAVLGPCVPGPCRHLTLC